MRATLAPITPHHAALTAETEPLEPSNGSKDYVCPRQNGHFMANLPSISPTYYFAAPKRTQLVGAVRNRMRAWIMRCVGSRPDVPRKRESVGGAQSRY